MHGLRWILVGALLPLPLCAALAGEEPPKDSGAAQREIQSLFHGRHAEDRVTALQRLKELPPLDAAKLALQIGHDDRSIEVRRAAYRTLLTWKDRREVGDFLLKIAALKARSKTANNAAALVPLLAVLAAFDQPDVQHGLQDFVTGHLAASKNNLATLLAMADELGDEGDAVAVATLRRLTAWNQFTAIFAFRRAVVRGLIHCRQADAVDALVGLLGLVDGEVHGDVVQYLTALTKLPYGDEINDWKSWWKQRKRDFTFDKPVAEAAAPNVAAAPRQAVSYYGLAVRGRRLVFVIDISGSMTGPRLAMAQRELTGAIGNLPPTSEFSIVVFNHRVVVWQRNLVPASAANKEVATRYVAGLQACGTTATYDALGAAFRFDAEAIYFLTDGKPTCGRVVDPAQIAALAAQTDRLRRISIYTIGIAPGPVGGIFDTFLEMLAQQNYGSYRRVEQ